jgi:hypothetical protein
MSEENDHHDAAPPQVTESPGGQRAEAEQRKGADTIGHQIRPVRISELHGDGRDRGCKDQQEHVVDPVADIQQQTYGTRKPIGARCGLDKGGHGF